MSSLFYYTGQALHMTVICSQTYNSRYKASPSDMSSATFSILLFLHCCLEKNRKRNIVLLLYLVNSWCCCFTILKLTHYVLMYALLSPAPHTLSKPQSTHASIPHPTQVDITEVPDFNKMYELYDPCTVMFFFRNKHIMIDLGTGNNNKINWAIEDEQELIDIIELVYRGARKGRGLVVSLRDYSTKNKY